MRRGDAAHHGRVAARVVEQRQPQRHHAAASTAPRRRPAAPGSSRARGGGGRCASAPASTQASVAAMRDARTPAARSCGSKPGARRATLAAGLAGTPVCSEIQTTQMTSAQPLKKSSENQSISARHAALAASAARTRPASRAPAGRASARGPDVAWQSRRDTPTEREPQRQRDVAARSWRRQRQSVHSASGQAGQVNHSSSRPSCHVQSRAVAGARRQLPQVERSRPAPPTRARASTMASGPRQARAAALRSASSAGRSAAAPPTAEQRSPSPARRSAPSPAAPSSEAQRGARARDTAAPRGRRRSAAAKPAAPARAWSRGRAAAGRARRSARAARRRRWRARSRSGCASPPNANGTRLRRLGCARGGTPRTRWPASVERPAAARTGCAPRSRGVDPGGAAAR